MYKSKKSLVMVGVLTVILAAGAAFTEPDSKGSTDGISELKAELDALKLKVKSLEDQLQTEKEKSLTPAPAGNQAPIAPEQFNELN